MRDKELFKHLRMGCGESLRTGLMDKTLTKKVCPSHFSKENKKKLRKDHC